MEQAIYQIFDKVFKKILTLSSTSVVNLINGLFSTSYPLNSSVQYNWTEFMDDDLKRVLADTIITINNERSYHIEAQMTDDADIIFRVFDYGFRHASNSTQRNGIHGILYFPEPKIIYLYSERKKVPKEYILELNFGKQGNFLYKVSTFNFLESTISELNKKRMIILIPFQLLKLRDSLKEKRTPENLEALKNLIQHDIIKSIDENHDAGNITMSDALKLKRLTHQLYQYIYSHYEEMEEINDMTDESLILDIDILEKEFEEKLAAKEAQLSEMDTVLSAKNAALSEKDAALSEKDAALSEKDAEIAVLKKQLQELQKRNK